MNTTDILQVLNDIAQQINQPNGLQILYGSQYENNKTTDEINYPIIIIEEPIISHETIRAGGTISTAYELKLFFANKAEIDSNPQQRRLAINVMRNLAKEYVIKINTYTYTNGRKAFNISNGQEFTLTDIINSIYDVGLTGASLEITIPINEYNTIYFTN